MSNFLVLVPTPTELKILEPLLLPNVAQAGGRLSLCGFGPVAAAARTSQLIAQLKPDEIVLVGIAGAIGNSLPVGSASEFDEVCCFGVGVGTGENFQTASSLGWPQWDDGTPCQNHKIGDVLPLRSSAITTGETQPAARRQLLTCCAGSANAEEVTLKSEAFPDATAEDMEGFGVAMAAAMADIPVRIVRGISNVAGDRRLSEWKIQEALETAAQLVLKLIAADGRAG